jgi:hypothetical protein
VLSSVFNAGSPAISYKLLTTQTLLLLLSKMMRLAVAVV